MRYSWLTFSTCLYYKSSSRSLGGGVRSDYVVDMACVNLERLFKLFPGCFVVLYYNTGVPVHFLEKAKQFQRLIMVFCESKDLRTPMLGRLSEFDVRRTDWTVTLDIHDDLRHRGMHDVLDYIRSLPRTFPTSFDTIRHASWNLSQWDDAPGIQRVRRHLGAGFNSMPDAAGFMVHKSAPKVPIEPILTTVGRSVEYVDDEIVLFRWLSHIDRTCVDKCAPAFKEIDLDMGGIEILDKTPSCANEAKGYADEVWVVDGRRR